MSIVKTREPGAEVKLREGVELVLAQLDRLPVPSPIAAQLLSYVTSDHISVREIAELIESDAGLSAGILRMVGRANLGLHTRNMTVQKAVGLLGLKAVRNAALAREFFQLFNGARSEAEKDFCKRAWIHNIATACAAELLCKRAGSQSVDPAQAFLCGLLHDVGKLALFTCLPKSYARVIEKARAGRGHICDIEEEILGIDHTVAGKRLVSRWKMSEAVMEAAWLHHQSVRGLPATLRHPALVTIVAVANRLVSQAGWGVFGQGPTFYGDLEIDELRLDPPELDGLISEVRERCAGLCELLDIHDGFDPDEQIERLSKANRGLAVENTRLRNEIREHRRGGQTLRALNLFFDDVGGHESVQEFCHRAALAAKEAFEAESAVCFVLPRESGVLHLCGYELSAAMVLEPDESWRRGIEEASLSAELRKAPSWAQQLFRRASQEQRNANVWMLTFQAQHLYGGVLLGGAEETLKEPDSIDCRVLQNALCWAAGMALDREIGERATEDFVRLNRRMEHRQREMVQDRSLSMIAEMAAGAAHEVNNPLSVISGRAQMLLEALKHKENLSAPDDKENLCAPDDKEVLCAPDDKEVLCAPHDDRKSLGIIAEQAQRASEIISDLMRFAKPESPRPVAIELSSFLADLQQHWRRLPGLGDANISVGVADPHIAIFADRGHLREVMDAIVRNAGEASRGRLELKINCDAKASDETVRIAVTDNGVGMTPEVLNHALDPFYSHRPAGRGRGLGLSRAYRLVELNGGHLWIESQFNSGTTVTFQLPIAK